MRGDRDDAFLLQHHVFGKHAVDAAAERRSVHARPQVAAGPALEEAAGHLVAGLDADDAGTGFDHLAGAVGKRNEIVAHRHAIGAAHDAEVAVVERAGRDLDQDLAVERLRHRPLDLRQRVDAGAALRQLISTHSFLRYGAGRPAFSFGGQSAVSAIRRILISWEKRTSQGSTVPLTGAADR